MEGAGHDKFMRRCIELAAGAAGKTYPNPLVGSVVVNDGVIIGEGFHLKAGTPHAEVLAVNSVKERPLPATASIYVNLEPCSHYGKTPPCADFIIGSGIKRIFVGTVDTSSKVSGRGISRLKEAGCEVVTGILEEECRHLNRRFFTFHEKSRPYIILKWAESGDGFLDTDRLRGGETGPLWISGKPERALVHKWRSEEQAVLVGAGTVRADNPRLNVRSWSGADPLRLVLSASGDISHSSALLRDGKPVIIFTHNAETGIANAENILLSKQKSSARQIADHLFEKGIQSLFVEGGAKVLDHFIAEGLWDEMRIFRGNQTFGRGIKAPFPEGKSTGKTIFEGSTLTVYCRQ